MVCKEDVITWFNEAASHRRIDVMCSLLNMCVPFELRYLGTCLEEQGKHDYQELRGAAITANSLDKLAKDFCTFKGLMEPCARHRLTIYLSLLQSRNYCCANWIYNALMRTESVDTYLANNQHHFYKDVDMHAELLLLFTLALNHPAFTFEQKRFCGDVVTRLGVTEPDVPVQQQTLNLPPCPPGLGYNIKPPLPVHQIPLGVPKAHNDGPIPPPGIPLPPNVHGAEFGPGMWSRTHYINTSCPPPDITAFPPPISPLVSQQSSPTTSRSVSPSRMYSCRPHPPPMPPMAHMERIPPPIQPIKETLLPTQYNTDLKSVPIEEEEKSGSGWLEQMMLGNKLANGLITGIPPPPPPLCQSMAVPPPNKCHQQQYLSNEMQQLTLIDGGDASLRCTSSSASSNSSECHTPPDTPTDSMSSMVTPPPPHGPGRGLLIPPPPPLLSGGGGESKIRTNCGGPPPPGLSPIAAAAAAAAGTVVPPPPPPLDMMTSSSQPQQQQQQQQQQLYTSTCTVPYSTHYAVPPPPPPTTTFHNRSYLYTTQPYRPQFPPYQQQNGEIPYLFPYLCMYSTSSAAALPTPKITCYNCGRTGHIGGECKEPTIEEITQKKGYQLDYASPSPPDAPPPPTSAAQSTAAAPSTSSAEK